VKSWLGLTKVQEIFYVLSLQVLSELVYCQFLGVWLKNFSMGSDEKKELKLQRSREKASFTALVSLN